MKKELPKEDLGKWVRALGDFSVYTPVDRDGTLDFEIVGKGVVKNLGYRDVTIPLKRFTFPQNEALFRFNLEGDAGILVEETAFEGNRAIVLGVTPCSGRGLRLLDMVFNGNLKDSYYSKRRENTIVVGLSCNEPAENCFCTSVGGSPYSNDGLDVILTDLSDLYYVEAITDNGKEIINRAINLFTDPVPETEERVTKVREKAEDMLPVQIDNADLLRDNIIDYFDSPYWGETARSCIGCGICTYLCPTCHCFDINDEIESTEPLKGKRVRTWDNCQFPDFTMHSSGHNPRPDKGSRLRQRILHKFKYFPDRYQELMCTGCGRCSSLCPVGINILDVVNNIG